MLATLYQNYRQQHFPAGADPIKLPEERERETGREWERERDGEREKEREGERGERKRDGDKIR